MGRTVAFKQADVKRAVAGTRAAGVDVASVKVDRDGCITITAAAVPKETAAAAALDAWKEKRGARPA